MDEHNIISTEMNYYCDPFGGSIFYEYTEPLTETSIRITLETRDRLLYGMNELQQLLWIDDTITPDGTGNQIKLRDRMTKWDEETHSWIPDQEAIDAEKRRLFLISAQQKFDEYILFTYPYAFSKLKTKQKTDLFAYLDLLTAIIDGTDTESTELPKVPF